jgi:stringent starvation protein B
MTVKKFTILIVTVLLILVFIGAQPLSTALATSEGPLYPSTGASVLVEEGTIAWFNPGFIAADDNVEAQVDLLGGEISEYLQGTDFGFAIPTGATIEGIVVTIGRSSSGTGANPIQDHSVMLVKGGSLAGDNNAALGVKWPANHIEAARVYSPTDPLWGTTWTAEEINAADFGVALSVINPNTAARSGFVDYINIAVTYIMPTTLNVSPVHYYYGYYTTFSATLTPAVADKTIAFTRNGAAACSALTNVAGVATCQAPLLADVGTYPSGVGASFAGDVDYGPSSGTASLIIDPRPASVTPDNATKTYGSDDPVLTATLNNFIPPDGITYTCSRDAGETVAGSPYEIHCVLSPLDKLSNYDITYNTADFTITPKAASVTPNAASKVYGAADPSLSGTLTGFLPADNVSVVYSREAGETVAGSPYEISAVLSPAGVLGNYDITYNTADFTITPKAASVTPNAASKVYGAADPTLSGTLTGFQVADGVSAVYSREAGETVAGSPYEISAVLSPAGVLGNYTITYNTADFTITPKAASVTPNAASKVYGAADPALSGTLTGFLPADNVSAVYSREAGETVAGGPYEISAVLSPAGVLGNYDITYNTANFTITPKAASVTPDAASKVYGAADPTLSGTLTGFQVADGVSAVYSREAGETVAGGPYEISAVLSPEGVLGNYDITYNTADFTITPKAASVTPDAASKVVGTPDPALSGTLTGFLPADNVSAVYSRTPGETVAGSPYTISAVLSPAGVLGNYDITYNTANFTITEMQMFLPLILR